MRKVPIRWYRGTWDYGTKENLGFDAIPTIHDASIEGYTANEWKSGIGWGSDLYLSSLLASGVTTPYTGVTPPSGSRWFPVIDTGYFYVGMDEYYLYSEKGTVTGTPSSSILALVSSNDRYPPVPAPVTVTLGSSEFSSIEPFTKTYEPTPSGTTSRSPTKFRRRADLTGRRETIVSGTVADGIVPLPYTFTLGNMQFLLNSTGTIGSTWSWSIESNPTGSAVTVEYETSDTRQYTATGVDMNPLNSYEVANSFCVVLDQSKLVVNEVVVNNAAKYLVGKFLPILLIAAVKDQYGTPIPDRVVTFTGAWGSFSDSTVTTIWDGTAATWFTPGSVNITGVVTASCEGQIGRVWIPGGKI